MKDTICNFGDNGTVTMAEYDIVSLDARLVSEHEPANLTYVIRINRKITHSNLLR